MKVLHIPFTYFPDPIGGTEVYVRDLIAGLCPLGVDAVVLADSDRPRSYNHDGVRVRRIALPRAANLRQQYGLPGPAVNAALSDVIDAERPDLAHIHAPTWAATPGVVAQFHRRDIPVVFTYHSPLATCQRGTLMRWGTEICDGRLDLDRCTACTLHAHGLPKTAARVVARVPAAAAHRLGREGGPWTALRMRELMSIRLDSVRAFLREVDRIVVLSGWSHTLLLANGIAPECMTLSRHGIESGGDLPVRAPLSAPPPLRIAFLGRLDPVKGPDILVRALRLMPDAPIVLDLYGIAQEPGGGHYLAALRTLAAGDDRIRFLPPVPSDRVIPLLRGYHALAVPSRWLETGPLVVLEAFAAGIPILGMDRGGIGEIVTDERDGLLVAGEDPTLWASALKRLLSEPSLLARLGRGVRAPRSTGDVAADMMAVYSSLLAPAGVAR